MEGTILSVISAFADELEAAAGEVDAPADTRSGFARALDRARRALADTPRQMALLQKAGVVDAGAQGFVDLLEGIAEFVEGAPNACCWAKDWIGNVFAPHWKRWARTPS